MIDISAISLSKVIAMMVDNQLAREEYGDVNRSGEKSSLDVILNQAIAVLQAA